MNLNLASQIAFWVPFVGFELIFLGALFLWWFKKSKFESSVKYFSLAAVGLLIFSWIGEILVYFLEVKNSPLGKVLLSENRDFFWSQVWQFSQVFLFALAIAIILYFLAKIIIKFQKRPVLANSTPGVLFVSSLIFSLTGIFGFIPVIFLALILAIIFQLVGILGKKSSLKDRVVIDPFIFFASAVLFILGLFSFYRNFLANIHLI